MFNASGGYVEPNANGRFPANLIHDGSEEVVDLFPKTSPSQKSYRGLQYSGGHAGIIEESSKLKEIGFSS